MFRFALIFVFLSCATFKQSPVYTPKIEKDKGVICKQVPKNEKDTVYEFELFNNIRDCKKSEYFKLLVDGYVENDFKKEEEKALKDKRILSLFFKDNINEYSHDSSKFKNAYIITVDIHTRLLSCVKRLKIYGNLAIGLRNKNIIISSKGFKVIQHCEYMIQMLSKGQIISSLSQSGLIEKLRRTQIESMASENPTLRKYKNDAFLKIARVGMPAKLLFLSVDFPKIKRRTIASTSDYDEIKYLNYNNEIITLKNNKVIKILKRNRY